MLNGPSTRQSATQSFDTYPAIHRFQHIVMYSATNSIWAVYLSMPGSAMSRRPSRCASFPSRRSALFRSD